MPPIRYSLALAGIRVVIASSSTPSIVMLRSWTQGANTSARMAARFVFVRPAASALSEFMETLLAAGHGKQTWRRNAPLAARSRQRVPFFCKQPGPDAVDIRQHPAVMGRERPAEHRAEIGVGCVHDDAVRPPAS